MDELEIKKVVETLLFITDQPLPVERISQICNLKENKIQKALDMLVEDYEARTLQIMNIAGGYQMATRQEYSLWIRRLYNNRMTVRLSAAALETLSIIAYKQPITRAEVEAIRGVEVIGPLETLLERRLITTVGRKESVGRPLLYGTTKEFLRQFGLNSLDNLPDINTLVDQEPTAIAAQDIESMPFSNEQPMDDNSITQDAEKTVDGISEDNPSAENESNEAELGVEKEQDKISSDDFDNKIGEAITEIEEKKADISDDESSVAEQAMDDKDKEGL
jgi:segregation and condensation protein B